MKYRGLYFEDFTVGRRFETDTRTITEADIIAYGKEFAPPNMDSLAASTSMW